MTYRELCESATLKQLWYERRELVNRIKYEGSSDITDVRLALVEKLIKQKEKK